MYAICCCVVLLWAHHWSNVLVLFTVQVIPGKHGFIAQMNKGRHLQKRPTEFRVDKVLQPFDEKKFNFTKIGQEEILFQFEASESGEVEFIPEAPIEIENCPSVVAINVNISLTPQQHIGILSWIILKCLVT